jgi:hypothetical protein
MSAPDLTPNIQSNAQGPQAATVDGTSVTSNPIPDQIEADKYLKANDAVAGSTRRGLVITKLRPPGAI